MFLGKYIVFQLSNSIILLLYYEYSIQEVEARVKVASLTILILINIAFKNNPTYFDRLILSWLKILFLFLQEEPPMPFFFSC